MKLVVSVAALLALLSATTASRGEDLLPSAPCPPPETRSERPVRLSCACLPATPAAWWPLQENGRDYCGTHHGSLDGSRAGVTNLSFSPLGIRSALGAAKGSLVEVPAEPGSLDGMTRFSLAVVVRTDRGTQPLVTKDRAGGNDAENGRSYSFRLDNDYVVLELFGEPTERRDSCVSLRSNRKLKGAELKRDGGTLISAVWNGRNSAAFYANTRPLGGTLQRTCKGSPVTVRATDTAVWIGASAHRDATLEDGFSGLIRDVVLYRRALAPREVCQLADLLVPGPAPSPCARPGG